jgi:CHAT domain-containing protein/tetratricopeptide (TPR) repeat protein
LLGVSDYRGSLLVFGNTHHPSISLCWLVLPLILFQGLPAQAAPRSCTAALGRPAVDSDLVAFTGAHPAAVQLPVAAGGDYLVSADARGSDTTLEVRGADGALLAQADHPERRSGTRRAVVSVRESSTLTVSVAAKERDDRQAAVRVRLYDLEHLRDDPVCVAVLKQLAAGDTEYADGTQIRSRATDQGDAGARGAFVRAAAAYEGAQAALTDPADRTLRGEAELAVASTEYFDLEDWDQTVSWAQRASQDLSADPYRRARADALVAAAWLELGTAPRLMKARAEALRLARYHLQRGERYDAALQYMNAGLSDYYQGLFSQGIPLAQTAAELFGALGETGRRAIAWQNRALCLRGLGRLREALQWFERARRDTGPQPYPVLYFDVVNNTAQNHYALGDFDEALRLFEESRRLAQQLKWRRFEAESLLGFGETYYALGDLPRARVLLQQALELASPEIDRRQNREILRALATVIAEQGEPALALDYDRKALTLARSPTSIAHVRLQLATHTVAAGQLAQAQALLDDILAGAAPGDRYLRAEALLQRAIVWRLLGHAHEAIADLSAARPQLHAFGSVGDEFKADLELARAERQLGEPAAALAAVDRSIGRSALIRLQTSNPELRSQLQAPLRAAYDLKIELLRSQYETAAAAARATVAARLGAQAFLTADAARAKTLADVAALEYPPAFLRAHAAEFRHRDDIYRELAARRYALDQLLDTAAADDPRARHLVADITDLERRADTINTEMAQRAGSRGAAARGGSRLPSMPGGSVLVSYWVGDESAYAWVVTASGEVQWLRLQPPAEITGQALVYHQALTHLVDQPPEQRLQAAQALYRLVVEPLEPRLSGTPLWVVIPDGALAYVPFAALRDPKSGQFVALHHDIALVPAAWMLSAPAAGESRPPTRLLLVADPVYQSDDQRLPAGVRRPDNGPFDPARQRLQRLPLTAEEAARIAALFPPGETDQFIGFAATRDRLLSLDWSQYGFIHLATHGVVDAEVPALSALLLSFYDGSGRRIEGALRVADLSLLRLRAQVAVFSACETALGKEVPSEGLVGISSTVLARGAGAVVASLWQVSDEMSVRLMTDLYRHLLHDSMSAPAALGAAMRSVVTHDASADPALWAAFQVSVSALGAGVPIGTNATAANIVTPRELP